MPQLMEFTASRRALEAQLKELEKQYKICVLGLEIEFQVRDFDLLREVARNWRLSVFKGQIEFDAQFEDELKDRITKATHRAKRLEADPLIKFVEAPLADLLRQSALYFEDQLNHWLTPKLAVGPAARVKIPKEIEEKMIARMKELSA